MEAVISLARSFGFFKMRVTLMQVWISVALVSTAVGKLLF